VACCLAPVHGFAASKSVDEATAAEKNAAAQAYRKAMAEFDKNQLEQALKGFQDSYGIVRSPNSHFMIARTLARLGRNVEAYNELNATITEADGLGPKYEETVHAAYSKLDEIKPRISFVVVNVANAPKGTVVAAGDEPVNEKQLGKPVAVLPGETAVTATAPGQTKRTQKVTVAPGATGEVRFDMSTPPPEAKPPEHVYHAPYFVELEGQVVGETLAPPYPATRGAGLGARASFPVVPTGVLGTRDNFALSSGIDWIATSTDPHFIVPFEVQWNFWLIDDLSIRLEPGAAILFGAGTRVVPSLYAGVRYRLWKQLYVHARAGVPLAAIGLSLFM
jgi:hypothetical protein